MISSVLEKEHSKIGSDVKITVCDNLASDESDDDLPDRSPSPPPPRTILVSNFEPSFQNKIALTKYFENAKRSGGGEIEVIEYHHGKDRASITFKDHSG